MSIKRGVLTAVGCTVALVLVMGCASLPKSEARGDLDAQIGEYQRQAVKLRGLALTNSIAIEQETSATLLKSLEAELDKEENRKFMAELELVMRQFRLLKREQSLRQAMLGLMQQQVAAYYDPEKKRLVYISGQEMQSADSGRVSPFEAERFIYVHEFCHALEDAHYDLESLMKAAQHDIDSDLALTAFTEGNAVLAGIDGLLDGNGLPTGTGAALPSWLLGFLSMLSMDDESVTGQLEGVPTFLTGALLRPYLDGTVFSNRLRRDAGWTAIDRVYNGNLPQTTAEILYPEKRYLKGFQAAEFTPAPAVAQDAGQGVLTNRLGALAIALWLNGDKLEAPGKYGFLKGWLGDRLYIVKGDEHGNHAVWLSLWERGGEARAFCREVEKRFTTDFGDTSWTVERNRRLVVAVWSDNAEFGSERCSDLAQLASSTKVTRDCGRGWLAATLNDLPWPLRFPVYPQHSVGFELLGGYLFEACGGERFYRTSMASGALRAESNPDRHDYGLAWGLLQHTSDKRCDYTRWKVPLVMSWHGRGAADERRLRWKVLWGLLADGTEKRARILFVPVWHDKQE